MMNIAEIALTRHATKAFDPTRKIPADVVNQIETLLRFGPSSTNSQPWHFFIAESDEGKARIAQAVQGTYSSNDPKIRNASHVVVFCTRATLDDAHLSALLDQETSDGRLRSDESRANYHRTRSFYVDMHRFERRDVQHWMEKQVYLAVGTLLLGAGALGIDACPIEGFDQIVLDEVLGLHERGLVSSVIVALGYRSGEDFNAQLPKSRLPAEAVITRL
ncbi:oxygen-insensitive NAD(P)H nitroreductase [Paludibacterium purpuratum]|uniref:Dihydropteridine reductase n=1 Tax=Paludibacterium purpuratum TaxID=1144873 RepID=A0A4R7B1G4_9NEIS|nr:oxygen-insensitive NAD(P)H nitroreductase [Paludibacterium purpuratum]TDR73294.1 dihydropteridine reductase [Paludibacterium purpuratum]